MFFGVSEIESVENDVVTLKNGDEIAVTEKNKALFTEGPITGSELQEKMIRELAESIKNVVLSTESAEERTKIIIDIFADENIRLVDISMVWDVILSDFLDVKSRTDATIEGKNNETIVNALGKEKLDAFSRIFGANEDAPNNSIRQIRMKDIFNT